MIIPNKHLVCMMDACMEIFMYVGRFELLVPISWKTGLNLDTKIFLRISPFFTFFLNKSLSAALQETKRFEAVANLVSENNCYEHAHRLNTMLGTVYHAYSKLGFKQFRLE